MDHWLVAKRGRYEAAKHLFCGTRSVCIHGNHSCVLSLGGIHGIFANYRGTDNDLGVEHPAFT